MIVNTNKLFDYKLTSEDSRLFGSLLTPSWFSGLLAVLVGLMFSVGVIIAFEANLSTINQQLVVWHLAQPPAPRSVPGATVTDNNRPDLQNSWPLLVVWAVVGALVYVLGATLVHSVIRAESFREALKYVHANRQTMWTETLQHLLLRAIAAALLIGFSLILWNHIIPYAVTAAYACAANPVSLSGALYLLLSFAVMVVSVHLETILLRLSAGRARVFS